MFKSAAYCTVILNGIELDGLSEDEDAIMLPGEVELYNVSIGAQGDLIAFRTAERGGEVAFKFQPTSVSGRMIGVLLEKIRNNSAVIRFDGTVVDDVAGETFTLQKGVLLKGPLGNTYGKGAAANRVYTFRFQDIIAEWGTADYELAEASEVAL